VAEPGVKVAVASGDTLGVETPEDDTEVAGEPLDKVVADRLWVCVTVVVYVAEPGLMDAVRIEVAVGVEAPEDDTEVAGEPLETCVTERLWVCVTLPVEVVVTLFDTDVVVEMDRVGEAAGEPLGAVVEERL